MGLRDIAFGIAGTVLGGGVALLASIGSGGAPSGPLPTPTPVVALVPDNMVCPVGWTEFQRNGRDELGRPYLACDIKTPTESWNLTIKADGTRIAVRYVGGPIVTLDNAGEIDALLARLP